MTFAISVAGLSKRYRIRHLAQRRHDSLRDLIVENGRAVLSRLAGHGTRRASREEIEDFWALRNVSFKVQQGERIGVIGRNGAGKSTLLKVLSRITEPTTGRIEIGGRMSSLLEVGTGFHPELTGRENIYLNGAILGMRYGEIRRRFDAIVDFAEIERFLDTPVKRYSSGMYVRLAFSVAAHMEPEILVVDEVLAVGDAAFQRKCLGKMEEAGQGGQTVIFVSHQMAAIQKLCSRCLLLNGGLLHNDGPTEQVVKQYLEIGRELVQPALLQRTDRRGTQRLKFARIQLVREELASGVLKVHLLINNPGLARIDNLKISADVNDALGNHISNLTNYVVNHPIPVCKAETLVELNIRDINLVAGRYSLSLFMATDRHNSEILDWIDDAARFEVPERDFYGTGTLPPVKSGVVLMNYEYVVK